MQRILLICDDQHFAQELTKRLQEFDLTIASAEDRALLLARRLQPDLIAIRHMPGRIVSRLIRKLRGDPRTRNIQTLDFSESTNEACEQPSRMDASCLPSETLCFENVLATIKRSAAVSASGRADDKMIVEHLGITVDAARHRAFMAEVELELTPTEFRLLHCLIHKPGQVIARRHLLEALNASGRQLGEQRLYNHINALRRKLGDSDLIENVWGVGFRFRETSNLSSSVIRAAPRRKRLMTIV